jgi:hypothetical protein
MAGSETNEQMLRESRLVMLQNTIVDPRFAAAAFRNFQNYIGQSLGNGQEIFHYICPSPDLMVSLMDGLQALTLKTANVTSPEIRTAMIAFGLRREYFDQLTDAEIEQMREAYRRIYELD